VTTPDLSDVLVLDLELDGHGRLTAAAAVLGGAAEVWESPAATAEGLARLAARARWVCAHNGHAHDLPRIQGWWPDHPALRLPLLDTLLWSPLAFPERPYHRLVKDRELVRVEGNDPLSDARGARQVLADELQWLEGRRDDRRLGLVRLAMEHHLRGAQWAGAAAALLGGVTTGPDDAVATWEGQVCEAARRRIALGPETWMAAAYVSMWLPLEQGSVLPAWVRRTFPASAQLVRTLRDHDCGACPWCLENHAPLAQLRRWFPAFDGFRPTPALPDGSSVQEAIVRAGLEERSLLAILPTGGGKSVCFQVPAFARYRRRGALTVVLSPLQSLMKDQVDNLLQRSLYPHAAAVHGGLSLPERRDVLTRVADGDIALLYVSPEQLRNPSVRRALRSREIGAWVLDEAHCVAEWGHDFRPDYWYAPRFIRELAEDQAVEGEVVIPPVVALTATAQPRVVMQLTALLRDRLGLELLRFDGGVERSNLTYRVERLPREGREGRVLELLDEHLGGEGAAVVFVPRRKAGEQLAGLLEKNGWEAAAYHAGLGATERRETQDRFLRGALRVIAATSAFGMGVDKPDIRLVVHMSMPSSLESYVQQAGRAGRDGLPATCVLLHDERDLDQELVDQTRSRLGQRDIEGVLREVRRRAKRASVEITPGELVRLVADAPVEGAASGETQVVTAVSWLERAGFLRRDENHARVFQGRPRVRVLEEARGVLEGAGFEPTEVAACMALLRELMQASDGRSSDDLADLAGLAGSGDAFGAGLKVIDLLERMVRAGVLADGVQLAATVAVGVPLSSNERLATVARLEDRLLARAEELHPDPDLGPEADAELNLRRLTADLAQEEPGVLPETVLQLLRAHDGRAGGWTLKHAGGQRYLVRFRAGWPAIRERARRRRHAAQLVLDVLLGRTTGQRGKDVPVSFALADVVDAIARSLLPCFAPSELVPAANEALLFLHDLRVLTLQHGLAVFRQAMSLKVVADTRRRYTRADFAGLEEHYAARDLQLAAMNAYADRGARSPEEAAKLRRDWFTTDLDTFARAWMPERDPAAAAQRRILKPLDDDQRLVVMQPEDADTVVVAGPGSGKTTTVVHRVAWLVRGRRVPPEGLLVLCYNRATAIDLRRRLRDPRVLGDAGAAVTVLTLHGLALRLVGAALAGEGEDRFDRVIEEATALLRSSDDRPGLAGDELRSRLLGRWTHLFVDEYQDVDDHQAALLDALVRRSRDDREGRLVVFAVGDDDQNIYAFRGASPEHLRRFEAEYGAKRLFLLQNYRSTPAIIDAANALIAGAPGRLKSEPGRMDTQRKERRYGGVLEDDRYGGRVVRVDAAGPAAAAGFILEELRRLKGVLVDAGWEQFAVLARHRRSLWPLHNLLASAGIPCRVPLPERPPLRRVREIARVLDALDGVKGALRSADLRAHVDALRGRSADNPWWQWVDAAIEEWLEEIGEAPFVGSAVADALRDRMDDERRAPDVGHGVHLGTQHGAKGLQWPVVFVLGDGLDGDDPEGERRLAYVAMTRARQALYLVRGWGRSAWERLPPQRTVMADVAPPGWRAVEREVLGLGDLWIDFAARSAPGDRIHRALDRLGHGDRLELVQQGDWLRLVDRRGDAVAGIAGSARARVAALRPRLRTITVLAMVQRRREDSEQGEYQQRCRVDTWWVPVVVLELEPRG
jgi:ATP-dependent DNA helicase RecQ